MVWDSETADQRSRRERDVRERKEEVDRRVREVVGEMKRPEGVLRR